MGSEIVIALDAMGGDKAPGMVVRGASIARVRHPHLRFRLFGDERRLKPLVERFRRLAAACTIEHTEEVVEATDKPAFALRQRKGSSMSLAVRAVHEGRAAGVVSAGNTGALMAIAKVVLKTLPGISRPAMASVFPTLRGESVLLDLGANIDCGADNLFQFAVMGEVYARSVLLIEKPTVALLNVGEEELKGNEVIRTAAAKVRESGLPIDFKGFVEGDDIAAGTVDVVVADGFVGNVALKTAEGTARLYTEFLRAAFRRSVFSKLGFFLARPALHAFRDRVDPRRYNGAMLLGLNGIVVKSHGGTDHRGFATAIGMAADMITQGFNARIIDELQRLHAVPVPEPETIAV
ncbi:MAG TPA: phosphate acyltransferase PlsX [Alphaproteobacteria bacterium]|nr:phosphate acyltransferase PlsX [Alphaproteobacteria bacterium]